MTTARRQVVIDRFAENLAALEDDTVPVKVQLRRRRPWSKGVGRALSIKPGGQRRIDETTEDARYLLDIEVECQTAVVDNDEDLDAEISELYALVVETALSDYSLGGAAIDVRESDMSDPNDAGGEGSGASASFSIGFEVEYFTAPGDPRSPA